MLNSGSAISGVLVVFIVIFVIEMTVAAAVEDLFFAESFESNIFENNYSNKWVKSDLERYYGQDIQLKPSLIAVDGFEDDNGLRLVMDNRHYGLGTKFSSPFTITQNLVIQYDLKLEEGLPCGGAYLKLLRGDVLLNELSDKSPFSISKY